MVAATVAAALAAVTAADLVMLLSIQYAEKATAHPASPSKRPQGKVKLSDRCFSV